MSERSVKTPQADGLVGVYQPNAELFPSEQFCAKHGHLWRYPADRCSGVVCDRCGVEAT